MGMATFIRDKFLGREICVWMGVDIESINFDQFSLNNTGFFRGTVVDVDIDSDMLTLDVPDVGEIYINCDSSGGNIKAIWLPEFDFHKAVNASLTNKMFGSRKYNK